MSTTSVKRSIAQVTSGGTASRPKVIDQAAFEQVKAIAARTSGVDGKERALISSFIQGAKQPDATYQFDASGNRAAAAFMDAYPLGDTGASAAKVRDAFERGHDANNAQFLVDRYTSKTVADLPPGSDAAKRAASIRVDVDNGEASDTLMVLADKKTGGIALFHPTEGESDYRLWTYTSDGKFAGLLDASDDGSFGWDTDGVKG
jgi:hypothetical protein